MTRSRLACFLSLILVAGLVPPTAVALPKKKVDKETKNARRALKKNLKRLSAMGAQLKKLNDTLIQTSYKDEAKRKTLAQQIEDQRVAALEQLPKVTAANSDKAALAIMNFAISVHDQVLHERASEALGELSDEEAVDFLVGALEGPHSERKKIPGASHMMHEDNALAFNTAVLEFLAKI